MWDRRAVVGAVLGCAGLVAGLIAATLGPVAPGLAAALLSVAAGTVAVWTGERLQREESDHDRASRAALEAERALRDARQRIQELEDIELALPSDPGPLPRRRRTDPQTMPPPVTVDDSLFDDETGLLNGRYFRAALEERISSARRYLRPVTVVLLEFTAPAGQRDPGREGVATLAQVIRSTVRDADTVCRLDDGAFALILDDTADTSAVWALERVKRASAVEGPWRLRAGVASYPTHGLASVEVLGCAELALDQARLNGTEGIQVARSE